MKESIEGRIVKLTQSITNLPEKDKKEIIEIADYREWGLALDELCFIVDDLNINITKDQYKEISSLGTDMGMEEFIWVGLKRLIKT